MHKLTAQDILFDTITSFGLGDVVKAKTPGEDMMFEGGFKIEQNDANTSVAVAAAVPFPSRRDNVLPPHTKSPTTTTTTTLPKQVPNSCTYQHTTPSYSTTSPTRCPSKPLPGVIIEHMVKRDGTEMVLVDFGENEVELCNASDCVKVPPPAARARARLGTVPARPPARPLQPTQSN